MTAACRKSGWRRSWCPGSGDIGGLAAVQFRVPRRDLHQCPRCSRKRLDSQTLPGRARRQGCFEPVWCAAVASPALLAVRAPKPDDSTALPSLSSLPLLRGDLAGSSTGRPRLPQAEVGGGQPIVLDGVLDACNDTIELFRLDCLRLPLELLDLRGKLCQRLRHVLSWRLGDEKNTAKSDCRLQWSASNTEYRSSRASTCRFPPGLQRQAGRPNRPARGGTAER